MKAVGAFFICFSYSGEVTLGCFLAEPGGSLFCLMAEPGRADYTGLLALVGLDERFGVPGPLFLAITKSFCSLAWEPLPFEEG